MVLSLPAGGTTFPNSHSGRVITSCNTSCYSICPGLWHYDCFMYLPKKGGESQMRKQKGFTLIELLIVVAIIGIIAAIAIPNLLNAIDRGKQKRSMADIRSLGTATESYAVDNNFYP